MPKNSPHAPLPIAFWAERRPDGSIVVESHPSRLPKNIRTPADLPVLVNDLPTLRASNAVPTSLQPFLLDIRELFSFTHPVSGADEVPVILGVLYGDFRPRTGAAELAATWPHALAAFGEWHPLLSETVVQILSSSTPAWRAVAASISGSSALSLEAQTLSDSSPDSLLSKLRPSYDRLPKRDIPDPSTASPIDPNEPATILGPSGACASLVKGYEHRPGQLLMTRAVADAFNRSKHLVVEAGTGVGKSLAYLLPSILWARQNHLPVVISTNTKNLQTQLFEKDIPTLRHVLETPFSAALIKGRSNYVCLRRLQRILERRESEVSDEEAVPFAKTLAWISRTATGDLDELDRVVSDGGPGGFSLKSRLSCPSEECGGRRCRFFNRCLLQRARACSLSADIIVANHSLVFAESSENQTVFPKYHQLVFDEAHNLEESATRQFTIEISPLRFLLVLRRLWRTTKNGGTGALADFRLALQSNGTAIPTDLVDELFESAQEAIFAADKTHTASEDFFRSLALIPTPASGPTIRYRDTDLTSPAWAAILPKLKTLNETLDKLSNKLSSILKATHPEEDESSTPTFQGLPNQTLWDESVRALSAARAFLQELLSNLSFVITANDPDTVYWLSVTSGRSERHGRREPVGILQAAPIDISQKLADSIFKARQSIILCSATLSISGSFAFLAHRIGLDKLEAGRLLVCRAPSPFDYNRQSLTSVPLFLPDPTAPSYTTEFAAFLIRLFQRTRGRSLVLFTSYSMMKATAELVAPALKSAGIQLLVQGSGASRDRLVRIFRRDITSILFGTDSFWEGVDVMGESLSCVVLARLPFVSPGDPLTSARADRVKEETGSSFNDFQIPMAIIRLRQGVGRLIRHRDDHGLVIIADNRIAKQRYGFQFQQNIPGRLLSYHTEEDLYSAAEPFLSASSKPSSPCPNHA